MQNTLTNKLVAKNKALYNTILVIVGSLFLAVMAQITVPMFPVPMTLQTLAVMSIGFAYGSKLGAATIMLYLLEGAVGLPVFAGGKSGFAVFIGPTTGYLIGFVFQAYIAGLYVEKFKKSFFGFVIAALIASSIMYILGLVVLAIFYGMKTFEYGLYPFVYGAIAKMLIASGIFQVSYALKDSKKEK